MNISENKRVFGLATVFALAFAGTMYFGYTKSQEFEQSKQKLDEINNRFLDYDTAEVPPTKKNLDELKKAFDDVSKISKELEQKLNKYAVYCYGDGKQMSAQDYQNQLRDSIAKIAQQAKDKGATIAHPAADLGNANYKNSAPVADIVPFLSFQLKAVHRTSSIILDSGCSVLDKVYCAPLPEEAEEAAKPKSRKAAAYFPLSYQIAFECKQGVLPKVVNGILADKDFMLTITGIAVSGNSSLPHIDAYKDAAAPQAQGVDITAEAAPAPAAAAEHIVAVRKTGDPNETVRVHLNMQVLYFNPAKSGK